jgi:glycosyltransferase involved in cell wall biosynthesis
MTLLAMLALMVWLYLLLARGRFWQAGPILQARLSPAYPPVAVVIPARNEAAVIETTLRSLVGQDYRGPFGVIAVDDASTDGTGTRARTLDDRRLMVIEGTPPPSDWSGKLWAVAQGVETADHISLPLCARGPGGAGVAVGGRPLERPTQLAATTGGGEFILLTDADIVHDPLHLATLVAHAETGGFDMVSEMVALSCDSLAERALVPAFVYFFQLLYPFAWVNDPLRATAAAAGGTILIRRRALARIGGIAAMRGALIDDVALAKAVKAGGRIWLGHAALARSVRRYPRFRDIWTMVARSAYVQLRCSRLLLSATMLGMALTFLAAPVAALFGQGLAQFLGWLTWIGMAASYLPTLRRMRGSPAWVVALPAIALFYMAATIGSAIDYHTGRGVRWKQRVYQNA